MRYGGKYNGSGVYIFRTRRPGLFGRVPLIGRHFGYVGQAMHIRHRKDVHLKGSMKYNVFPKPWSSLKPSWYFIPLPPFRWILLTVETMVIALLWPVYNHQKNLWNPRRIPLKTATRQRAQRDLIGWSFNFRPAHAMLWTIFICVMLGKGWMPWQ